MSFPITTSLRVVKEPQWVLETTRGVMPDPASFTWAGPIQDYSYTVDTNSVNYRKLGSPDLYKVIQNGQRFQFDLAYNPVDRVLLSKGVNLDSEDSTHNREQSLSFLLSQEMNNAGSLAEHYIVAKGCSCDSTTVDVSLEAVNVSQTWIANDIPIPSTSEPITTPTYATPGTQEPWTGITSGSDPLTWGGTSYTPRTFSATVSHNTDQIQPLGEANVFATIPTIRDITFSFDIIHEDNTLVSDADSVTPKELIYKLSTDTQLKFTDAYITSYNEAISATSTEAKTISYSGVARSAVCESYT
ncbi:MAG: hypothetical protein ACPKPY_05530 [Nitrososphaeraceae archaeon]